MAIDTSVTPQGSVRMGIKGETTFGTAIDSSNPDTTAYRQLPVVTATKPTFNTTRESRLLSGKGTMKDLDDTVQTRKNGTVTTPFEFIATPQLLLQHLILVGQDVTADGSDVYTVEFDGSSNGTSSGAVISGGLPHSVNLAYDTGVTASGITIPGNVVSDLTIGADYGSSGGFVTCSGNYFSGFANAASVGATGSYMERTYTGTWVEPNAGTFINMGDLTTKTLDCDSTSNAQDLIMKSWSITINNGVVRVGSNSDGNAEAYAYPEYTATGNVVVKYDTEIGLAATQNAVQHFLDGTIASLLLKFGPDGTVSSVGEMNILAECQYSGDPTLDAGAEGMFWNIPFECGVSGSTEGLKISLFSDDSINNM